MQSVKKAKNLALAALLLGSMQSSLAQMHVIFDIPVLFETSKSGMFGEIMKAGGFFSTIGSIIGGKIFELESISFDVMNKLGKQSGPFIVYNPLDGKPLPSVMVSWLSGAKNGGQILTELEAPINSHKFAGKTQKRQVGAVLKAIFDAQKLAQYTQPVHKTVDIFEDVIKHIQKQNVYILSNWDVPSYNGLKSTKHGKEIFNKIPQEHVMISGATHKLLPSQDAFDHFLKTYNLNPADCILINHEKHIVEKARSLGMKAIWMEDLDKDSCKKCLQELKKLGVA